MELSWLQRRGGRDLLIYMLGWAATPNAVCHIPHPPGVDVLAVHRYSRLVPLPAADVAAYRRIYLIAWSFGVWAAEQCCRQLPLHRAIAFNGTPFPAHEQYGMRLRATLRAMQVAARTGKAPQSAERAIPAGPWPEPGLQAKADELMFLAAASRQHSAAHLSWHAAYIAEQDEVFPPANMWAYWRSVGLGTSIPGYHYPFADPARVLRELAL